MRLNLDSKIRLNCSLLHQSECTGDKGNNKELVVDNFATQPTLQNPYGWPMNDIMAFETAQSESVARAVLQRIKVNPEAKPEDVKLSVEQQFDSLCPANWDSPAEFIRYQKASAEMAYKRAQKRFEAKQKAEAEKIKFTDPDKEGV